MHGIASPLIALPDDGPAERVYDMEQDWLAVALIYSTLANAEAAASSGLDYTQGKDEYINRMAMYRRKAEDALKAAGVQQ